MHAPSPLAASRFSRFRVSVPAALLAAALFAAPSAKADITINGSSYSGPVNLSGANYTISRTGTVSNRLIVKENCTITFDNVSFPLSTGTTNAISIFPGKTVTLKLSGENTITLSGTKQTGISVPSTSSLNITNITDDAKLIVTATGTRSLAIGGQYCAGKCGTVNIWGGAISASSGTYSAGIGSYNTDGGTVNIYGGTVVAKGGTYGAGIGGGSGAGGTVNSYGGTVWATAGRADSAYESDIGKGASGSTGSVVITGGSTIATNGKMDATAKDSDGTRVHRVAVTTPDANADYTFSGLGSYGQTTLRSNSSKLLHLWLPNGTHAFEDDDYGYAATVASANTAATRTAKVLVTFADSDGTIIATMKELPGAALAPPNVTDRDAS